MKRLLGKPISILAALKGALVGLVVALMIMSAASPAAAATEAVTGTATTSGGDGFTTVDFEYSSPGLLGSGTLHFDFVLIFDGGGVRTEGTGVLTRSDGATLTGTETSAVDLSTWPPAVVIHFTVTSGTGALAGVTGEIVLTGTNAPGAIGDVFTMTGSLSTGIAGAPSRARHDRPPPPPPPTEPGGPRVQACVGETVSALATSQEHPGEFGDLIAFFARLTPPTQPGIGDGILTLMAGELDDEVVPNTCND